MADDYSKSITEIQNEVKQLESLLSKTISEFTNRTGIPVVVYISDPQQMQIGSKTMHQDIYVKAVI